MAIGWKRATENLRPWTTKYINLMIEWGQSCWTARNGMICREKQQRHTMEKKRLQEEVRVNLNAPKEESLVPIENFRATRMNLRNLPNIEIANWIAGQRQLRQKIQQRRTTNISMHMRQEVELQILDHRFRTRVNNATGNITTTYWRNSNCLYWLDNLVDQQWSWISEGHEEGSAYNLECF